MQPGDRVKELANTQSQRTGTILKIAYYVQWDDGTKSFSGMEQQLELLESYDKPELSPETELSPEDELFSLELELQELASLDTSKFDDNELRRWQNQTASQSRLLQARRGIKREYLAGGPKKEPSRLPKQT